MKQLNEILAEVRLLKIELSREKISNKHILSLKEAAEYTNLSDSTLYKMTASKTIRYYKPNKRIYFKKDDLDDYLLKNIVISNDDVEEIAINNLLTHKIKRS